MKNLPGQRDIDPPSSVLEGVLGGLRPYVRQAGNDWRKPWKINGRKLFDYLLVYVPEGEGVFSVGGKEFAVNDGDLVWIPPDTVHVMQGASKQMHCLYIHFDLYYDPARSHWDACIPGGVVDLTPWKEWIHPAVNEPVLSCLTGKIPICNQVKLKDLMIEICHKHSRYGNQACLELSGLMMSLIGLIVQDYWLFESEMSNLNNLKKINDAALYIQENINHDLDIADLAKRFHLSDSHFRKLFRQVHGRSPRSMHRRARMHKACELLNYTDMNVSEIADFLGFKSIHNFSRAFKEVTGFSPSGYRC